MSRLVLVTGAAGGVGARLMPRLRSAGWRVRALVHRREVDADERVYGDLRDGAGVAQAVAEVDAILHLAAVTHARDPREYELNVSGTQALVAAAPQTRFLHVSTCAVSPQGGAYSASKAEAEEVARRTSRDCVIVRLPEVYGTGDGEGIDDIVRRARAGRIIFVVGDGSDQVCPVHVDDVVDALVTALEAPSGRLYVLAGDCTPVRRFAEDVVELVGSKSRIVGVPANAIAAASFLSRVAPLPLYPDQLARLRAPKERDTTSAREELAFRPRTLSEALGGERVDALTGR